MLIASKKSTKNKMKILMTLVIAMFIIVGVYVGYNVSQQASEEAEGHNITMELEILNESSGLIQILQNSEFRKTII